MTRMFLSIEEECDNIESLDAYKGEKRWKEYGEVG